MGTIKAISCQPLFIIFLCLLGFSESSHARQDMGQADLYYQKAKQLGDASQFDSSIYYYQMALKVYEVNKDWRGFVKSHIGLGACYTWLSKFEMANDYLMNGLKTGIDSLGKLDSIVAENYEAIGFYHGRSGDFEKQMLAHQEALNIGLEVLGPDHPKVAEFYSNYGTSYGNKGDFGKAIVYLQKGLGIRLKLKNDPLGLFQSYNNLGAIFMKNGDFSKSLSFFQKGLSLIQADSTRSVEVAIGYNNIGRTFEAMGNLDIAFSYFEKALESFNNVLGDGHYYSGIMRNNLGSLLLQKNDYDNALSYFSTSQNIFKKSDPNHPYVALTHVNMAKCYGKKGQSRKDLMHLEDAIALQKKILPPDHPDIATTLNNLGIHYSQANNPEKALRFFQEALITLIPEFEDKDFYVNPSVNEEMNSKMILLKVLENKGNAMKSLFFKNRNDIQSLEQALNTFQIAIQVIDFIRFGFSAKESQKEFTKETFTVYEGAIQVANLLYELTHEEKYVDQAFQISQRSKAFLLLQAIKTSEGLKFAGVPDSLIDQERDLKINIAFYARALHLAKQKQDTRNTSLYQDYLFQFNSELDKLRARFEEAYPMYYKLINNHKQPVISDIQKSITEEGTVLLDYFVGDSTLNIFCISKDKQRLLAYKKPENFEALVKGFKKSTEDWRFINNQSAQADELYVNSAFRLYQLLLKEPLESFQKPVKKLTVIPGGIVGYINFEAFISEIPSDTKRFRYKELAYLIKKYDIKYLYSASSGLNGKDNIMATQHENSGQFAGFAVQDVSLPGAIREVERIAETMSGDAWIGGLATERNFKAEAHNYPLLHLSMHAFLDDGNPLYSKFVFTQSQDKVEDDSLTIAEIYNIRLNAQLAVLSACETGAGALSRGEGIMSLSRAFAYAGCPSVVTSLWKVDSETTTDLMMDFYTNLKNGQPKDRSLRLAKLDYLKKTEDPIRAHPHFWLSFIVTGDTAPLKLEEQNKWWIAWALFLGLIIGSFLLWKNPPIKGYP